MCCIVSGVPHLVQAPLLLRFAILSQYFPHLCVSWMSFHRKFLTFVERSCLFVSRATQMRSSVGQQFSKLFIVSHVRFRFVRVDLQLGFLGFWPFIISLYAVAWVRHDSQAPAWLCSGDVMNSVFCVLFRVVPSLASLSARLFPSIPEWPFIHLRVVAPACFFFLLF